MQHKNLIIGTAGHIDHGKTTLIKALTGTDTDRLMEEKKRGISIELGFTGITLTSGQKYGIVDVPGHEKFIKNMLAGAGGVDLTLLVIAADEGFMPQTEEHLNILNLLDVKYGMVVLTKIDMVEEEWLNLVIEDTREGLKDTFLAEAPIIPVSAVNGQGMELLFNTLEELINKIPVKEDKGNVYFPIDRVFSLAGFGTIVTGTLVSGRINVEDILSLYPGGEKVRVRSLQVHNQQVKTAYPGQRVGINLAGIEKEELERGDVLASEDSLITTEYLDARLKVLANVSFTLQHGDRIRFHLGSREVLGRVYLLDCKELKPGEEGLVQFRLEEKIVAIFKENYIVRRYSPLETIGGGIIITNHPPRRKKFDSKVLKELKIKEKGSRVDRVELALKLKKDKAMSLKELIWETNLSEDELEEILVGLIEEEKAVTFSSPQRSSWLHYNTYCLLKEEIVAAAESYHQRYPLRIGIFLEELRTKLTVELSSLEFNQILAALEEKALIEIIGPHLKMADFTITFGSREKEIKDLIMQKYEEGKYTPPLYTELINEINTGKDEELIKDIINALLTAGELVRIDREILFTADILRDGERILREYLREKDTIGLGEYSDLLNSSRKYVLPLLEYFDEQGLTVRKGDRRILADT